MHMQIKLKKMLLILLIILFSTTLSYAETFLSLKKNKVNVRYGPSFQSPIKFVYKKINLPIKLIDKKENWRRVVDLKNNSGWIHRSQLKPTNSIIPLKSKILFKNPSYFSKPLAKIQKGRLLIIQKCNNSWCKVKSNKFKGWIEIENIWGSAK